MSEVASVAFITIDPIASFAFFMGDIVCFAFAFAFPFPLGCPRIGDAFGAILQLPTPAF